MKSYCGNYILGCLVPYKKFPRRIYLSLLLLRVFAFTCTPISINLSIPSIILLQKGA